MNVIRTATWCIVATLLTFSIAAGLNNAAALQQGPPNGQQGIEVLTRGPVHEAFAETVTFDPEPGIVVPKAPPDADRGIAAGTATGGSQRGLDSRLLGLGRRADRFPVGQRHLASVAAGSPMGARLLGPVRSRRSMDFGYWADAKASEVEYLPEPPATVEVGPNMAAPSADHTWLPGCWVWQQNRYAWRPGYWAAGQSDWDWVPAHYVWTPRGYVFVDGYYDYSVARRGVLFAPVYFNSGVYSQRGFSYSPATVINLAVFASHLFLRPSYGHYYFGDYYGSNYATAGFSPWFSFNSSRYGYDPFYAQQRWINRQDPAWDQNNQANFQNLLAHENVRPPRTWADQNTRLASGGAQNGQNIAVATSFDELAKSKDHSLRFQNVDQAERQKLSQHGQAVSQHRDQRQKLELSATDSSAAKLNSPREIHPTKATLPVSPIAALPADRLGKDHTPPARHEVLKPDLSIPPTARNVGGKANSGQVEPRRAPGATEVQLPKVASQETPRSRFENSAARKTRRVIRSPRQKESQRGNRRDHRSGRSNDQPQGGPPAKAPGKAKGPPPAKSNVNPLDQPQDKPQGEAKGSSPGRSNGKPQGAPKGKPQGEAKNNPKQ